jgi:AraC-like DNA-binding protein
LPEIVHIRGRDGATRRLAQLIDLIMEECAAEWPARDMVLQRLLDAMLVECLRRPGISHGAPPAGLLAGLQDPALARVLRSMHAGVRANWTVAELANIAGMSRSAFSARFSQVLGCAPMEYLLRWRMTLAQDQLSRGGKPLEQVAEEVGYESASAFSTAFRRRLGCSPGAFARARRTGRPGPLHVAAGPNSDL